MYTEGKFSFFFFFFLPFPFSPLVVVSTLVPLAIHVVQRTVLLYHYTEHIHIDTHPHTERVLYVPSMGLCLFIATGMEGLMKRKTSPFITAATFIALSILLMSFSVRTFVRNYDWKSEEALYTAGIAINPAKGKFALLLSIALIIHPHQTHVFSIHTAYGNLGNIVSAHGRKVQAEYFYRQALQHRSNMADVHYNL